MILEQDNLTQLFNFNTMNLQFISDNKGLTAGVFIPIGDWKKLTQKYNGLNNEFDIPEWHKEIVRDRIKNSKPEDYIPWEVVEKKLDAKYK